jgi:hypothetical protein
MLLGFVLSKRDIKANPEKKSRTSPAWGRFKTIRESNE